MSLVNVTSDYTITNPTPVYTVDASSNDITVTLPSLSSNVGSIVTISRTDAMNDSRVYVKANGTDTMGCDQITRTEIYVNDGMGLLATLKGWFLVTRASYATPLLQA